MIQNFVNIFLGATNIVLFFVWLNMVKVEVVTGSVMETARIDSLGLGLAIVEALVAIVALGLVALAIVGYGEIRSASERRADQTAREVAREVADEEIRKFNAQRARDTANQSSIGVAHAGQFQAAGTEDTEEYEEE